MPETGMDKLISMQAKEVRQMPTKHIYIKGAREHNLKDIDLKLPRDSLIVFTGLSGSGNPRWHLIRFTQRLEELEKHDDKHKKQNVLFHETPPIARLLRLCHPQDVGVDLFAGCRIVMHAVHRRKAAAL